MRARAPRAMAALAVGALISAEARAQTQPIRIDYQTHEGCPDAAAFLDEITRRTSLPRVAAPGEQALEVEVRIAQRDTGSVGRIVLRTSGSARARSVDGGTCGEVVSALALITALAVDPRAAPSLSPGAPAPTPPAPDAPAPAPLNAPPQPAPLGAPSGATPFLSPTAPPFRSWPTAPTAPPPTPAIWALGARAAASFAVAPRPLFGGGLFVERRSEAGIEPAIRLSFELSATGSFDVGPGGVSFVRGIGRIDGCVFAWRPARRVRLVPCAGAEGGFLLGEGIRRGQIVKVNQAVVPWLGIGILPRLAIDVGVAGFLEAQGGPVFPLVRRTFHFANPEVRIHEVPPVTATATLGLGFHFR